MPILDDVVDAPPEDSFLALYPLGLSRCDGTSFVYKTHWEKRTIWLNESIC